MKSITATLKICFALMLLDVALVGQPAFAYQVGNYNCNSGFQACSSGLQSTMSECMGECCEYGGCGAGGDPEEICYDTVTTVTYTDGTYIVNTEETCPTINEDIYNCAQSCMTNYEDSTSYCLSTYCSYQG